MPSPEISCNKNTKMKVTSSMIFFLFILLIYSNPFFYWLFGKEIQIILGPVIAIYWGIHKRIKLNLNDLMVFTLIVPIVITHFFIFGSATVVSSISFLFKFIVALVMIRTIPNIFEMYIFIMYKISILSLIFFIPVFLGIDLNNILSPIAMSDGYGGIHILLHHFKLEQLGEGVNRNMSFFGEPGLFAGFLILALLFMLKNSNKFPKKYFVVLIFTLLTTQSTMGYLVGLGVILFLYIARNSDNSRMSATLTSSTKLMSTSVLIIVFSMTFNTLPFLNEKINTHFEMTEAKNDGWELTRYGNAMLDLDYIAQRPLTGWSNLLETRQLDGEDFAKRQGNGLTGFAVRYGLIGILLFFIFAFRTLSNYYGNWILALISISLIGIMLNGEPFLSLPIFLSLMFKPGNSMFKKIS